MQQKTCKNEWDSEEDLKKVDYSRVFIISEKKAGGGRWVCVRICVGVWINSQLKNIPLSNSSCYEHSCKDVVKKDDFDIGILNKDCNRHFIKIPEKNPFFKENNVEWKFRLIQHYLDSVHSKGLRNKIMLSVLFSYLPSLLGHLIQCLLKNHKWSLLLFSC